MFRKYMLWRISGLGKPGQTAVSVSEALVALPPSPGIRVWEQRGQRPARLLRQLKEGRVPWGGQRGGDPVTHVS